MKKTIWGFSLIELMVVIAIIGILVGVGFIYLGNYQDKQDDNRRQEAIAALATAIEQFKADHGHYPLVNWDDSVSACEIVKYNYSPYLNCEECKGTDASYGSNNTSPTNPGTEIKFDPDGRACDDLSLQLLGVAYLPKMPNFSKGDSKDLWVVNPESRKIAVVSPWISEPSNSALKRYLTSIPKDPKYGTGSFRYFYNSYCGPGLNAGDNYWINAVLATGNQTDYLYEVGSIDSGSCPRLTQ